MTDTPCTKCPFKDNTKVLPTLPEGRIATVVGLAPGDVEVQMGENFRGPAGKLLRRSLKTAGIDPSKLGYVNLTRCMPPQNNFNATWKRAQKHCAAFLESDLASGTEPLIAVGADPMKYLLGDNRKQITKARGLWYSRPGEQTRPVFATVHPSYVLRSRWHDQDEEKAFIDDLRRAGQRILGSRSLPKVRKLIVDSFAEAQRALTALTGRKKPWAFDIEAYDVKATPSRPKVATNPFHPDFRVRGVAVAISPFAGFWFEFAACEEIHNGHAAEFRDLINRAFRSPAEKYAFNGSYDEQGLVRQGWVRKNVRNRVGDGMLALIALGDGRLLSNSLPRAVTEVLGWPEHWEADKRYMRVLPVDKVADGAIRDACETFALTTFLHQRLERGKYVKPGLADKGPTVAYA